MSNKLEGKILKFLGNTYKEAIGKIDFSFQTKKCFNGRKSEATMIGLTTIKLNACQLMVATPQQPQKMTVEEYFEWESHQYVRYEYVNGKVFAMTGGTIPHNDIALNFYTALRPHLHSRGCRVNVSDVKVQVTSKNSYYYPDVIVSCDPQDLNARKFIQNPKLIAEVLSPGTSAKDRGEKFSDYQTIPTLQEYILIDSEKTSVERYCRGEGRMWLYYPYIAGDSITLSSIEFELPIELIYEGILLETEE